MSVEPEVLARLARLLKVDAAELAVRPLPGGMSNRSFLLVRDEDRWAVRLPFAAGEGGGRLETLDAATEEAVLAAASAARLTPEVAAVDSLTGAVVTRFLDRATRWTPERARRPENIERVAVTLRCLHRLEVPAGLKPFRPLGLARSYVQAAGQTLRNADEAPVGDDDAWGEELGHLARRYEAEFPARALCHNDLVAANILDDGGLWLVDFEYALRADPILDLASLAGMNEFDDAQRRLLLASYSVPEVKPLGADALDWVIRLVRLLSYFWAVARCSGDRKTEQAWRFAEAMAAVLR